MKSYLSVVDAACMRVNSQTLDDVTPEHTVSQLCPFDPIFQPTPTSDAVLGQLVPTKLAPVKVKDRATLCSAIVGHPVVTEVILG